MAKLISALFRKRDNREEVHLLSDRQKMLFAAALGMAALCCMAWWSGEDTADAAYRVVWLVLGGIVLTAAYYASYERRERCVNHALLLILSVCSQVGLMYLFAGAPGITGHSVGCGQMLLILPYVLAPGLVSCLLGRGPGMYAGLCATVCGLGVLPTDLTAIDVRNYIVISLSAGAWMALRCNLVDKRERMPYAGLTAGAVILFSYFVLNCLLPGSGDVLGADNAILWAAGIGLNIVIGALIGGFMPVLEDLFGITTLMKWLEWANTNNSVLTELRENAPGTYNHSIKVKSLAEAAAKAIGADATSAGVCCLYHDIGKLRNAMYFTENLPDQSASPHAQLTPEVSARYILQHVQDGVNIAREKGLDARIVDVIREHHGSLKATYFYNKALECYKAEKAKFDAGLIDTCPEEVCDEDFSYKGPSPTTRESGIVSMADAVQSAVTSLVSPSEQDIRKKIEAVFSERITTGHLNNSGLTLGDIEKIKEVFFENLKAKESRIAYPEAASMPAAPVTSADAIEIPEETPLKQGEKEA